MWRLKGWCWITGSPKVATLNALQRFLAPLTSQVAETYDWPAARFAVNTYLHATLPPSEFITSVRAVVLRDQAVLVVQDPDGYHIVPGGRREAGESFVETVVREVLEETGWQVTVGPLLGFKHFHYLTPQPPEVSAPYPDFVQLVYVAKAVFYRPEAKEQNGYELGAAFVERTALAVSQSEQLFLQAALAAIAA